MSLRDPFADREPKTGSGPPSRAATSGIDAPKAIEYVRQVAGRNTDTLLDTYVFSGNASPVRDVMVGGRWVVRDGRHGDEEEIARAWRKTVTRLA